MKKIELVEGFEYILKHKEKIIGVITQSDEDFNLILKPRGKNGNA